MLGEKNVDKPACYLILLLALLFPSSLFVLDHQVCGGFLTLILNFEISQQSFRNHRQECNLTPFPHNNIEVWKMLVCCT